MSNSFKTFSFIPYKFIEIKLDKSDNPNIDDIPRPRSGHRLVCHGVCIYSIGGYNPSITQQDYQDEEWQQNCPLFKELWQFNTLSHKWTKLCHSQDMPLALASHSAVSQGPYMLVFGGTAMPFGTATSNQLHICHLPSGKWDLYEVGGDMPEPMYGQGLVLKENELYVVGGTSGVLFSLEVHRLDIKERTWNFLRPNAENEINPVPRYRHEIIEYENKIMVFGGGQVEFADSINIIPTFDLDTKMWSITYTQPDIQTRAFPMRRKCHILQRIKDYVYIHGGINANTAYNDMWRINLKSMVWEDMKCTTSTPLYFHSSAATEDGCMYVFGGVYDGPENKRTDKILKIWLKIPKLQKICWEAIKHYFPHMSSICPNTLLQMGVPSIIVDGLHYPAPAFG